MSEINFDQPAILPTHGAAPNALLAARFTADEVSALIKDMIPRAIHADDAGEVDLVLLGLDLLGHRQFLAADHADAGV
jgi:hypothetical protein